MPRGLSRMLVCLCGAAVAGGELADVVEEDRTLERVELRGVEGDLGEEGVVHEDGGLFLVTGLGIAEQSAHIHFEGLGEAVEGGERRHGFAVLDLGDVGAGHVHACGELTLGQVAYVPQIADRVGHLETVVRHWGRGDKSERSRGRGRNLDNNALVAATAQGIDGAKLHQAAVVTTEDLPLFDRRHHGCHKLCVAGGARARNRSGCPITEHAMCLE